MDEIETTVCGGFPVIVHITSYVPPERKVVTCTTIDPPDPGELEYELLTRDGKPADFIERKMTQRDWDEIDDLISRELEAAEHDF